MKGMTYVLLGIAGTIVYQKVSENKPMLAREMRRMMKHNGKSVNKIKEIF